MNITQYRNVLSEIAHEINFDRPIDIWDTSINKLENVKSQIALKEKFTPQFARKTLVNYLVSADIPDEQVIAFTGHEDVGTLKYYKAKMSEQKKKEISDRVNQYYNKPY